MDLGNLGLFRMMNRKMNWLTQRQEVLAENVANADTPNYKSRDIVPFDFKTALRDMHRMGMARTQAGHIASGKSDETRSSDAGMRINKDRKPFETSPSRNGVVLEDQMNKIAETGMDYHTITNLYRKHVGMIKTAIGRNSGA